MNPPANTSTRGKWLALTAALLGWMFDGLEMGLFPLAGRRALVELLETQDDARIGTWMAVATAGFLVGAATGGVLFGWLGDRLGRVRAMTLSVLTYSIFSGLCGFATEAWHFGVLRFLSALGMGGEWSLGVALVMELWPNQSRAVLAGLIGAAANVGYLLVAVLSLGLTHWLPGMKSGLLALGLDQDWVDTLTSNDGWRLLMIMGAVPALLTFFIRLFVPESERWQREKSKGTTSHWAGRDLIAVAVGAAAAWGIIYLWVEDIDLVWRIAGTLVGLTVVTVSYLYPVFRFLRRAGAESQDREGPFGPTIRTMLLGACLSGIPLLGTWASIQWAPFWADQLSEQQAKEKNEAAGTKVAERDPDARAWTQFWSAFGAVLGTVLAAFMGNWFGRRLAYTLLCAGALGSSLLFFQGNTHYGPAFLASVCLAGGLTASFYGWLPLYLPELFRTKIRATGQGFSFNFGRIIAAIGALQTSALMGIFGGSYPQACSVMSLIYVLGLGIIWLAPETRGRPLPE